jgi:hypothetical protein
MVGKLLSSVNNKDIAHPEDMQRATVLFYKLIKNGYYLDDVELDLIIEASGEKLTDAMMEYFQGTIDVAHYLFQD